MLLTTRKRSLIVSKIYAQGARQYMGHNPKRELGTWGSNPRSATQRSFHHPDDHEKFPHLLTPIN